MVGLGLERALSFNEGAEVTARTVFRGAELIDVYVQEAGLDDPDDVADWPTADLMRGLLAEGLSVFDDFADLTLRDIVDGYALGCAFPDDEHECGGSVFNDYLAAWQATHEPDPDHG